MVLAGPATPALLGSIAAIGVAVAAVAMFDGYVGR